MSSEEELPAQIDEGTMTEADTSSPPPQKHHHDPYAANPNQPPTPLAANGEDFDHFDSAANTMLEDRVNSTQMDPSNPYSPPTRSVFSPQRGGLHAPMGLGNSPHGRGGGMGAGAGAGHPNFKSAFTLNNNAVVPQQGPPYPGDDGSWHPPHPQGAAPQYSMTGFVPYMPMMGVAAGGNMIMLPDGTVIANPAVNHGDGGATALASLAESEDVCQKVCEQIEYYFTPENVMKDEFLSQHMSPTGFAPLDIVADFKKVKKLSTKDLSVVVASVHRSTKLILRPDWEGRYWAGLYPAVCERSRCTVILLNVAVEATKDDVQSLIPDILPYHVHRFASGTVWYLTFPDAQLARQALFAAQAQAKRTMPAVQVRIRTDNIDRGYGDHEEGPSFQNTPSVNGANPLPGGLLIAGAQAATTQQQVAGPGIYTNANPHPNNNNFGDENSNDGRGANPNSPPIAGRGRGRGAAHPHYEVGSVPQPRSVQQQQQHLLAAKSVESLLESDEEAEAEAETEGDQPSVPRPPMAVTPGTHKRNAGASDKNPTSKKREGGKYSWADDDPDLGKNLPVQALVQGRGGEVISKFEKGTPIPQSASTSPTPAPAAAPTRDSNGAPMLPLALAVDEEEISNFQSDAAKGMKRMQDEQQRIRQRQQQQQAAKAQPPVGRGGYGRGAHNNSQGGHGAGNPQQQGRGGGSIPPQPASVAAAKSQDSAPGGAHVRSSIPPPATASRGRGRGGQPAPKAPTFAASDFPDLDGGAHASSSSPAEGEQVLGGWAAAVKAHTVSPWYPNTDKKEQPSASTASGEANPPKVVAAKYKPPHKKEAAPANSEKKDTEQKKASTTTQRSSEAKREKESTVTKKTPEKKNAAVEQVPELKARDDDSNTSSTKVASDGSSGGMTPTESEPSPSPLASTATPTEQQPAKELSMAERIRMKLAA